MTKPISIDSIEQLNSDTILVVCGNEAAAKALLKRNPRCSVQRSDQDDRIGLVYSTDDMNLQNAVRRA